MYDDRTSSETGDAVAAPVAWPTRRGRGVSELASCDACPSRAGCLVAALPQDYVAHQAVPIHTRLLLRGRQSLCREGDRFSSIYAVRSGSLKSQVATEDGRQQVIGIHMPGEILGSDGIATGRRTRTVVALEDSEVCVIAFPMLDRLMQEFPSALHWFHRAMSDELSRSSATVIRLRGATAEERIAGFLLDLSRRTPLRGTTVREFRLSVSRGDIAFHLGLTRETVSRVFSKLHRLHMVDGTQTVVRLNDPTALQRMACGSAANS